jgi:hypothetical protein
VSRLADFAAPRFLPVAGDQDSHLRLLSGDRVDNNDEIVGRGVGVPRDAVVLDDFVAGRAQHRDQRTHEFGGTTSVQSNHPITRRIYISGLDVWSLIARAGGQRRAGTTDAQAMTVLPPMTSWLTFTGFVNDAPCCRVPLTRDFAIRVSAW